MILNLGDAISSGVKGYIQGSQQGQERQRVQQQMTQQQEQFEMQKQQHGMQQATQSTQLEMMQEQLKQAQAQSQKMAQALSKESLFKAFESGSMMDINNFLDSDKNLGQLLPNIERVRPIDANSNMNVEGFEKPVIVSSIVNGRIKEEVKDLGYLEMITGYKSYKLAKDAEMASTKLTKVKAEEETKGFQAYKETNPTGSFKQYEEGVKPPSASEKLAQFKLDAQMNEAQVMDYVNSNPKGFREALSKGDLETKVGDRSLFSIAKKAQGENNISNTRRDFMDGMVSTLENTQRLRTKMKSSKFNWDAVSKAMDEVSKITGTEWRDKSPQEKSTMLDKFAFDSDLKTIMAGYIKAMSGAAVSDEERKFYEGAILGGNWATKETALASMDGFLSGVKGGIMSGVDGMIADYPATYLNYKDRVNGLDPEYQKQKAIKAAAQAELDRRRAAKGGK